LHSKELHFLKEYLESLGATIPKPEQKPKESTIPQEQKEVPKPKEPEPVPVEEEQEVDPEVIPPDNDPPLETPDESKEVTDEMRDEATNLKIEAMNASSEGKNEEALSLLTKAIRMNPHAGILYASRAQLLLVMKKPNAAIRDCNQAIKIAPDSAKGYKMRGRANRLLGNYEAALRDYQQGQKLDFDENTKKLESEIKPRAEALLSRKAKEERLQREKEAKEKDELRKQRQQAQKEAAERASREESDSMPDFGGMPGMKGGMPGGMPFGMSPEVLQKIMSDPEMMQAMQDPTFMAKLQEIQRNPANISKYQNDPTVQRLIKKFSTLFGGQQQGGMGGMGGMGGEEDDFPPDLEEEENFPSSEDVD